MLARVLVFLIPVSPRFFFFAYIPYCIVSTNRHPHQIVTLDLPYSPIFPRAARVLLFFFLPTNTHYVLLPYIVSYVRVLLLVSSHSPFLMSCHGELHSYHSKCGRWARGTTSVKPLQ